MVLAGFYANLGQDGIAVVVIGVDDETHRDAQQVERTHPQQQNQRSSKSLNPQTKTNPATYYSTPNVNILKFYEKVLSVRQTKKKSIKGREAVGWRQLYLSMV